MSEVSGASDAPVNVGSSAPDAPPTAPVESGADAGASTSADPETFTSGRKGLREWADTADEAPEAEASESYDDGAEDGGGWEDEGEGSEAPEPTLKGDSEKSGKTSTEPVEAAEGQPTGDRPYRIANADGSAVDLSDDVSFTYKADGAEKTRTLAEVIEFAQKGENYDRRSRELVQNQRSMEERANQWAQEQNLRVQQEKEQFYAQVDRFFRDPAYREQALDEYERIISNPEEIELRRRAEQASEYERQIEVRKAQDVQMWQQNVWGTVDTIIEEAKETYPHANPAEVRRRFAEAFRRDRQQALSEPFLKELIRMEHDRVDAPLQKTRSQ